MQKCRKLEKANPNRGKPLSPPPLPMPPSPLPLPPQPQHAQRVSERSERALGDPSESTGILA